MASASWCKETEEKINYTKLCRLLVDGGTQAVRSVFDGIHRPSSLKATLNGNKAALQKLKKPKGKVLNNEQWDKLYPPCGSKPKSEDFDITLLFVLLRNICGITPPVCEITASGKWKRSWDKLPHKTDNSKEANLLRVKHYRNSIIAHRSSTAINDGDFEQHWQDISSALLSLGLSQDDIDYLKSAPLGERDYNQLLDDWCISDKDIKIQLEDLKSDTADIKSDTADIKSDTADLKSDTADIKSDIADIKSDTADLKSETADIKSDIADLKSDTADLKSDTADLKSDTADLKSDTADLKSDTADLKSETADIKSNTALLPGIQEGISQLKNASSTHFQNLHINQLANSDFSSLIGSLSKAFHPNSRQWVLDKVKSHIYRGEKLQPCVMLITAGPGMGKSTIAAKICQTYKDLGCLAGCHFFQFSNSTRNNPRLMLQSIARQMCDTVPGYREALESKLQTDLGKKIPEMNCEELFTVLLEEPLQKLKANKQFVVVLDAIDECTSDLKNELLYVFKSKLSLLPGWLRFVTTSRPNVLKLEKYLNIEPENPQNRFDLEAFFTFELKKIHGDCDPDHNVVDLLVRISKGIFLVAFFLTDYLKKFKIDSLKELLELFTNGISSVYENYFSRLKEEILPYISEEEGFYKMLEAVVASKMLLPKKMFYNILGLKSERDIPRTKKRARQDALNSLHSLFPVMNDHVTAFHKSVFDWLILQEDEKHNFSVRVEDGNDVLANQCYDVLSDIRNGKKDLDKPLNLTDSEKYALRFLRHYVEKLAFFNADKYGFYSNIYILTALAIETEPFFYWAGFDGAIFSLDGFISRSLCKILHETYCFPTYYTHDCLSCPHVRCCPPTFGQYFALILQAAHAEGLSNETTPNPLDALKTFHFPYFNEKSLFQTPFVSMRGKSSVLSSSLHCLFKCKNHFIAVAPTTCSNSLSTAVCMFQLDGCFIRQKFFPGRRLVTTSPNINFIVVVEENGNKIEILDVMTLEVVSQYESPYDVIQTCHVFGDDQGCFIVIKGCHDNKVYVIEGLTGQVRNTITVTEGSYVKDVSSQGHIVVTRTWQGQENELRTFTNKDGEVELMNWMNFSNFQSLLSPIKEKKVRQYRELSLFWYDRTRKPIPIYPQTEKISCCCYDFLADIVQDETIITSEDGRLLAYLYKDSIFIVNTSDGSLFRRCLFFTRTWDLDILFVSESYLVIIDEPNLVYNESVMFIINVQKNVIEHRIYLPHHFHQYRHKVLYLLFPEEDGKSFTLIRHLQKPNSFELSSLEFHNLNLQGL